VDRQSALDGYVGLMDPKDCMTPKSFRCRPEFAGEIDCSQRIQGGNELGDFDRNAADAIPWSVLRDETC